MSTYQLIGADDTAGVVRATDGAIIPPDPGNRDWQNFLAWAAAGNTPDPAPTPTPPTTIAVLTFFNRFTPTEQAAIWAAARDNPLLGVGLTNGLAAGQIDLTSVALKAWIDGVVAVGAVTADRGAEILTP